MNDRGAAYRLLGMVLAVLVILNATACGLFTSDPAPSPTAPSGSIPSLITTGSPTTTEPSTGMEIQPKATPELTPTATPSPTPTLTPTVTPVPTATPSPTVTTIGTEASTSPTPTAGEIPETGPSTSPVQFTIPQKTELKHPNAGSALNNLISRIEAGEISAEEAASEAPLHRGESIGVTILLSGNVRGVVAFLEANGASNIAAGEDYIEAFVPVLLVGTISEQPGVVRIRLIQPPDSPQTQSQIAGNGPEVHGSAAWNQAGYTGKGIKVGVIDVGFGNFATVMGTEVPAIVQVRCYGSFGEHSANLADCGSNTHGTVVAESVMDIAPEATLYISDPRSRSELKDAVDWMISEGISVINHSVLWSFDGPGDGSSPLSISPLNTIDTAVAAGIVWVNAAGNQALGSWFMRGPFDYTTVNSDGQDVRFIRFSGSEFKNTESFIGGLLELRWEDTWGGATTDLDFFALVRGADDIALQSTDTQSGGAGHDPLEQIRGFSTFDILVAHYSGPEPDWIQMLGWGPTRLTLSTPDTGSIINPAESANPGMLAVGAAPWHNLNSLETFSSRGPTPDGRVKPDVIAADCGETAARPNPFCGTSQAAPHVAGMVALVRQRFPSYSPAQVVSYLKDNAAQRVGGPDPNNAWGHGLLVLPSIPAGTNNLPGAPHISTWLQGEGAVTVSWLPPSDDGGSTISDYDLRHIRSDEPNKADSNWAALLSVWSGSGPLTYTVPRLTGGVYYDLQLRAVNAEGPGPWSSSTPVTPLVTVRVPGAPTRLTAIANGQTQIDLSWSAPSDDGGASITGYTIEVSEDGTAWSDLAADTGSAGISYSHLGLTAGNIRHYRVSAINSAGTGAASNVASGTTASADVPGMPAILSVTARAAGLSVSWSAPSQIGGSAIAAYDVRHIRSDAPNKADANWTVLQDAWSGSGTLEKDLAGLNGGTQYDVQVRAVNVAGDGPWSTTVMGTTASTISQPDAPANARYSHDGSTIVVSWDTSARAAYYVIYYDDFYESSCRLSSSGRPIYCEKLATDLMGTTYTHTSPDEDTNYYWVTACNSAGCSVIDRNSPARLEGVAPAPDLVVSTPTVSESAPAAGERFTLNATGRNQGNGSSVFTTLRYYQSADSTISIRDTEVGMDSVPRLDATESSDESISLTAPAAAGTYYYGACVEAVSDESDTANNCSSAVTLTVGAAPAPDLVVDTPTVSESAPAAGGRFTLNATVRNQGNGSSVFTTLRYYQSADSTISIRDTEVGMNSVPRLDATASSDESISVTAPAAAGTYYYGACVEAVSDESDTTNNCSAAVTLTVGAAPAPDLVVDTPTVSDSAPAAGGRFTLSATVRNQGNGSSVFTTLRYYQSADSTISIRDTEVGMNSVPRLDATASSDESISVTAPAAAGTYYYGACVEAVPDESDTTNNCSAAVTLTVGAAPAPDLVVDTPTVSESAPAVGARFTLNATVRNQGNGSSDSTTLRYYQSADSTISIRDTEVGTDTVSRLDAAESGDETISLTAPAAAGTYYYGACVDATTDESDTQNNCSASVAVTVGTSASAPGAPTGLTATADGQTEIDLSWTAPSDDGDSSITGYQIEVSEDGSNWRDLVANTGSTSTSYSHTGLTAGNTRHYRVSAINSAGTGAASNVASGTTASADVPGMPAILSVTAQAAGLSVSWSAPSQTGGSTIAAYDVRHIRSDAPNKADANWTVLQDAWSGSGTLEKDLAGLTSGTQYDVQVRAVSDAGDGPWSTTVMGTTVSTISKPDAPANPRYSHDGSTIVVSWDTSTGADYYVIYHDDFFESSCRLSSSGTPSFCEELATNINGTIYTHTSPDEDTNYYWVTACNSAGCSVIDRDSPARLEGAAPAPELEVETPTVDHIAPAAGERFTLRATVRNQGNATSDWTTLRYYQSADSTITSGDTEVGTDSVSRLDATDSSDESISLTAPAAAGTYYYGACVEAVSDESDTTNNCSAAVTLTVGAAPAPDLVVGTPTVSESAPAVGERFTLNATVRNQGNGSSVFTTLRYYQSADSTITTGDTEVGTDSVSRLDATDSSHETISLTAPAAAGTYYYGACVEAVSDESDTTNNCSAAVTLTVGAAPAPDLVVDTPTVSENAPAVGGRFTLNATVRNQGHGSSVFTTLHYYQSADSTITSGDTEVGTDSVSRLDATDSSDESISLTAPAAAGTYYYGACVEAVSDESDTTNNCSVAESVTVVSASGSDLVIESFRIPAVEFYFPTLPMYATVRNQGTGSSATTPVFFYLSTEATISTADMKIDGQYVRRLAPSETGTAQVTTTAESTPRHLLLRRVRRSCVG